MSFQLTTIATFRSPISAWMARNYLRERGLAAFVIDEHIPLTIWTWGNAVGWTKLQVPSEVRQTAIEALAAKQDARDELLEACRNSSLASELSSTASPPCMDRRPFTADELAEPKINLREDLVRRGKLAAVFAIVLLGVPLGLPNQWDHLNPLFPLVAALVFMAFSTRLLWRASKSTLPLRPRIQRDLFWGQLMNGLAYALLAVALLYVASWRARY